MNFLRRIDTPETFHLMRDIVDEGVDLYDPCEVDDVEEFIKKNLISCTHTFLLHWFNRDEEAYFKYRRFVYDKFDKLFGSDLEIYYSDKIKECEEF